MWYRALLDVAAVVVGLAAVGRVAIATAVAVGVAVGARGAADAGAYGCDDGLYLVVLEHPVYASPLNVEDLAPDRQHRLSLGIACPHGRAARGVPLDNEQLPAGRVGGCAILQLVGHAGTVQQ